MHAFDRKLNLLIGIPSMGTWTSGYGMCMLNMFSELLATKVPGYRDPRLKPMQVKGSILPRSRLNLVRGAQADHCTHLAMIDTDQTFPKDTIHRLLSHRKKVVGCNIVTKQIPASTTARKKSENFWGLPVFTDPDSPPLEKVWRLGAGIVLLEVDVFDKIGLGCFEIKWIEQIQDYQGEDWSMCEALEKAGIDIWVDQRLSDQIGHLGEYEYKHDVVGEKTLQELKVIGEA